MGWIGYIVGGIFFIGACILIAPAFINDNGEFKTNYTNKELRIYLPIGGILGIIGIACMIILP